MVKSELSGGDDIWNISAGYVNLRILKMMLECDKYEIISIYGVADIEEFLPAELKPIRRVEGLKRYKDNLKAIFENSGFVITKTDRAKFEELRKNLLEVEKWLDRTYTTKMNNVAHSSSMYINENFFNYCLSELRRIKEKINTHLNNANLIFRAGDEINLDDIMRDIKESG